ncbi:MAG: alpha/beta fold hydrolase [Trueperaceae bacterium]|nr:alpha/beta fold hydrolase [Trueperaceae bacterium]
MRAMAPHTQGYAARNSVRLWYEIYGKGEHTILLMPTWALFHSRHWKMQIAFLARSFRVVTFDGRGNGRSDRPDDDAGYGDADYVADAIAVLDETDTTTCTAVGLSWGAKWTVMLASQHPDRVAGAIAIAPAVPMGAPDPERAALIRWNERIGAPQGWEKHNRHYWLENYRDWVEFFVGKIYSEPHSTKQREDGVVWGLETDGATLVRTYLSPAVSPTDFVQRVSSLTTPLLVIYGTHDQVINTSVAEALADASRAEVLRIDGGGHGPMARDPVRVNLAIEDFATRISGRRRPAQAWSRGRSRTKRALYVSSPIGLGHARRDAGIADELRTLVPGLQVDWLAQSPVTSFLASRGERIHPMSAHLASEVAHVDRESSEHRLHCFQTIRRMDEILAANFMIFLDVLRDDTYDVVIGDEAWEVDYYLHENPELKTCAYVWMTDFVGWLPMPSGGGAEAMLTADYNEEMIRHIERYPRVRDRAIFIGDPDDIVPDRFGPELPHIRDWTEAHFSFAGYVTGFDPAPLLDRPGLRQELGYAPDETICVVTVGGSGVGLPLLRKIAAALPVVRNALPGLRTIMVAGPRIDPADIPSQPGLEVLRFVDGLHRHLAAADLAIVQGGLTTCMELTATRRPFIYIPLADHFEQNFHVRARLARYGAGRHMSYEDITPSALASAMVEELARTVAYGAVEHRGAARAATMIAELL